MNSLKAFVGSNTDWQAMVIAYGSQLAGAIITLIFGLWIIRILVAGLNRVMEKQIEDQTLRPFLKSLANMALKAMLIVSVLGMLGIEMTSFVAVLGAAGLAIGMAFSGNLQNLAGGVLILFFKPFKVGDVIEAQGHTGAVNQIQIFATHLKTGDNKTIILPNGPLSSGSVVNYSTEANRRIDWIFGIAYGDSTELARETLSKMLNEDERILKEPAPAILLSALADSSVNFTVRAWVKAENYWPVFFQMNEKVYNTFTKVGLNIPFPQMDVHVQEGT